METQTETLLTGRSLKTLTPAEIEELLALAGVGMNEIGQTDGLYEEDEGKPSQHPKFPIFYESRNLGTGESERLRFTTWSSNGDAGDYSSTECFIELGEIWCGWGPVNVVPVVKWFLDHGWSWSNTD